MSFQLPHLTNGWQVDQAIVTEEEKLVLIRFGHDLVRAANARLTE